MKGKTSFTKVEAATILNLIKEKMIAHSTQQRKLRKEIRNIGFYFTDFYASGTKYDTTSFENLIKEGTITIIS